MWSFYFQISSSYRFKAIALALVFYLKYCWIFLNQLFFFVWIPFTLSRFTWLIWKVDNFKFRNMHIYWFLFQILSFHSCWDIELTKSCKIIGTLPFLSLYLKIWFHPKFWSKCHYSGIYSLWIGCSCYSTVYFPLYSRFSCYLVIMRDLTD